MKKFLKYCINQIMQIAVLFAVILFAVQLIYCSFVGNSILPVYLISIAVFIVTIIYAYRKDKDYFERLYFKVATEYKIRDDYTNYVAMRDAVISYNYKGKVDIKQNIEVIQASLDRDQAYNIYWSVLLTAVGVLAGILQGKNMLDNFYAVTIYLLTLVVYMLSAIKIPRNSFIKKVVEDIDVNNESK